jgi:hypothetical protein
MADVRPAGEGPVGYGDFGSSLRDLPRLRSSRRRRASSWDRSGGNRDYAVLGPGETLRLCDIAGAGSVNHIWMTFGPKEFDEPLTAEGEQILRRLVLKAYWDGAEHPSVLTPLGDFFGVGFARTVNFASLPLQMSPEDGRGLNSFFHMPFAAGARFEVTSEMAEEEVILYYYVDYEAFDELDADLGRFHAGWHRENPTEGIDETGESNLDFLIEGTNLTGAENYVILDAEGRGHYVGCAMNVQSLRDTAEFDWYGEGDDMIFVDGEPFPPTLHGTGTEDYFNLAWCPAQAYSSAYHGMTLPGGPNFSGQISFYRFHIEDPITFSESLRVTIEHGHANKRSDDISSTAYWYQALPHRPLELPAVERRLPRPASS